jgi:hypothetical protein
MKYFPQGYSDGAQCLCGKVCFSKKRAQTKANFHHRQGRAKIFRIYQCHMSNLWHLTNGDRAHDETWRKREGWNL